MYVNFGKIFKRNMESYKNNEIIENLLHCTVFLYVPECLKTIFFIYLCTRFLFAAAKSKRKVSGGDVTKKTYQTICKGNSHLPQLLQLQRSVLMVDWVDWGTAIQGRE